MKIRIILVDDHQLIRMGVRMALMSEPDRYEIVGEAASVPELMHLLDGGIATDLILMDIIMPGMNGIDATRLVRGKYPDICILVMSSDASVHTIKELTRLNVDGYISKNYTEEELTLAIDSVMNGLSYFGRDISQILSDIRRSNKAVPDEVFSDRELEIIEMCRHGMTAKAIADKLCISPRTVSNHKANIFSKMGINSNYDMIEYAVAHGIISEI